MKIRIPKKKFAFVIVHENNDGEELERSEPFACEEDSCEMTARYLSRGTINFFEGDALRLVKVHA